MAGFEVTSVAESIRQHGSVAIPLFIVLGMAGMSMMVPKTLVSLAAGSLFPFPTACAVLILTAVLAAMVNYHIARWCWPIEKMKPITAHTGHAERPLADAPLASVLIYMARDAGFYLHLLIRLTPIPTTVISYSMGAAKAKRTPYLAAALVAAIPQLLYVYAANAALSNQASDDLQRLTSILSFGIAIVVSLVLPRIAMTQIRSIRQQPVTS
ncbi:VTT domain-containing protein [Stieleria sp. JC731]|uniref:TVP38/TMEM64 family protein n=1 Tax=Pirellulaceae TaxID=2691357 RepID=UPI001E4AE557|nr:VTT domain-containing protein [Stieleria sp. JC731]MCC9600582.1 VTT domain-containing protein [Stieleria sp. JC731]